MQVDQQIDEIFNSTGGIKETVSSGLIPMLSNQSNTSESSQSQASKLAKAAESAAQILAKKNIGKVCYSYNQLADDIDKILKFNCAF